MAIRQFLNPIKEEIDNKLDKIIDKIAKSYDIKD